MFVINICESCSVDIGSLETMSSFLSIVRTASRSLPNYSKLSETCLRRYPCLRQSFVHPCFCPKVVQTEHLQVRRFSVNDDKKKPAEDVKKVSEDKTFRPHTVDPEAFEEELKQLTILQRYKKLLKEYWYILIPVHGATSVLWFGSCFLLASSGVEIDLGSLVESLGLPETLKTYLSNPSLGSLAVAIALYKLASPFRYMTTVYAVIPAIKLLVRKRLIKPVPRLTSPKRIRTEISNIRNKMTKKRGE